MGFNLDVARWNYERNGLEANHLLEVDMFNEEYLEFDVAFRAYLTNNLLKEEDIVDMVDALCDSIFVDSGSKAKGIFREENTQKISYMMSIVTEVLLENNINPHTVIEQSLMYVVEANNLKPKKKTDGKVSKGSKWIDPKELIRDLLFPTIAEEEIKDEQE